MKIYFPRVLLIWNCLKLVGPREIGGSKRNGPDRPVPSGLEQRTSRRKQIDITATTFLGGCIGGVDIK